MSSSSGECPWKAFRSLIHVKSSAIDQSDALQWGYYAPILLKRRAREVGARIKRWGVNVDEDENGATRKWGG